VEQRNLPLLAICFGMQVLNVHRGGTLVQDIEAQTPEPLKHEQGSPSTRPSHSITVAKEGRLAGLDAVRNSEAPVRVNSSHHQAVKELGRDLVATAWATDGIVEAVEDTRPDRFAIGVQWHPELLTGHDEVSRELFKILCLSAAVTSVTTST
jgi:putative glutamine amidotransferase